MTRTIDEIYSYEKQALDLIEDRKDDPNYEEMKRLLIDQINDELNDQQNSISSDRRAS